MAEADVYLFICVDMQVNSLQVIRRIELKHKQSPVENIALSDSANLRLIPWQNFVFRGHKLIYRNKCILGLPWLMLKPSRNSGENRLCSFCVIIRESEVVKYIFPTDGGQWRQGAVLNDAPRKKKGHIAQANTTYTDDQRCLVWVLAAG